MFVGGPPPPPPPRPEFTCSDEMSADFAMSRVLPGSLFKLHADCELDIDFDFFDDNPSAPPTPSWSELGSQTARLVDGEGPEGPGTPGADGNVPSARLTSGPTPAGSSSGLSSASFVSLASALPGDEPDSGRASPAQVQTSLSTSEVVYSVGVGRLLACVRKRIIV